MTDEAPADKVLPPPNPPRSAQKPLQRIPSHAPQRQARQVAVPHLARPGLKPSRHDSSN